MATEKFTPPPIEPMSAEEVFKNVPPPSYDEIMGHQTLTSAKKEIPVEALPPLAYIDIMPRCLYPGNMNGNVPPEYDKFSTLMEAANQWLRGNPGYGVWKCETVERKMQSTGEILMESMLFHESTYGFNVIIIGIRLWLYARTGGPSPPQQLGLRTRVPDKMEVPVAVRGRRHFMGPAYLQTLTSYEGLKTTVEKFNRELICDPIGGTILNVECAVIKAAEGFERLDVDPENTVFYENGGSLRRYTQIIRLFYVLGAPARETFDLIDVIPRYTQKPGMGRSAKLETYEERMGRLSKYPPSELKEGRVVNFQTLFPKYTDYKGELDVHSNETDDFVSGTLGRKQMQIIRIFKVSGGSPKPLPTTLSSRLFVPVRTGPRSFETMQQTMYRIEAWLRVTGLYVYNVETIPYLFHEHSRSGVDANKSNIVFPVGVGKYFVTTIRVYFSQPYKEPNPYLLPPVIPWRSQGSTSCSIL